MIIVALLLIALLAFVPVGLIFKLLGWSPLFAFLLACLIAWTVKFAFIDSYIMIQMMGSYMSVAPETRIAFDLYGKLCKISSSFKELFGKGQQEGGGRQAPPREDYAGGESRPRPAYTQDGRPPMRPRPTQPQERPVQREAPRYIVCENCGEKNPPGTKFCGGCGERMGG